MAKILKCDRCGFIFNGKELCSLPNQIIFTHAYENEIYVDKSEKVVELCKDCMTTVLSVLDIVPDEFNRF